VFLFMSDCLFFLMRFSLVHTPSLHKWLFVFPDEFLFSTYTYCLWVITCFYWRVYMSYIYLPCMSDCYFFLMSFSLLHTLCCFYEFLFSTYTYSLWLIFFLGKSLWATLFCLDYCFLRTYIYRSWVNLCCSWRVSR